MATNGLAIDGIQRIPDFVIMGAQKCGTTSLHNYLKCHSDIFMSAIKEPALFRDKTLVLDYFNRKFKVHFNTVNEYHESVLEGLDNEQLFGESTTHYTALNIAREEHIPQNILSYNDKMKFIYIIRNPFDRLLSIYAHSIKNGYTASDIDTFFSTAPEHILTSCYYYQLSYYLDFFKYDQFLLLTFEEVTRDPAKALDKIYKHLGISYQQTDLPTSFKKHNKTFSLVTPSASHGYFSQTIYNTIASSLSQDIENLIRLGFNPDWDISFEKWGNEKEPFSLYFELGHLGLLNSKNLSELEFLLQHEDAPAIREGIYFALSNARFHGNNLELSIKYCREALKEGVENPYFFRHMGFVFMKNGDLADAEQCCIKAISISPHYAEAYFVLSHIHTRSNKIELAMQTVRRAISIDPLQPKYHVHISNLYFREKLYTEALSHLKEALKLQPNNRTFIERLAEIESKINHL